MQVAKDETSLAVYFAIVNEYGHKKEKMELAEQVRNYLSEHYKKKHKPKPGYKLDFAVQAVLSSAIKEQEEKAKQLLLLKKKSSVAKDDQAQKQLEHDRIVA
jgi:hypothetical protein